MSTREITWLLAQEARGTAQAIRQGMELQVREAQITSRGDEGGLSTEVLDRFAALDDAMDLLGNLQSNKGSHRRGRIDVAALLYDLCPQATIRLNTEQSTDVLGEEARVHRMLQLLLGVHASETAPGSGPIVDIHREQDWVHITAPLGPDAGFGLEQRWLKRMALRAGGRLDITGNGQSLLLPADGVAQERELLDLRQELQAAQQQGEVYARELAHILADAQTDVARLDRDEVAQARWDATANLASAGSFTLEAQREMGPELLCRALCLAAAGAASPLSEPPAAINPQQLMEKVNRPFASLVTAQDLRFELSVEDAKTSPGEFICVLGWLVAEALVRALAGTEVMLCLKSDEQVRSIGCRMIPDPRVTLLAQEQSAAGPPSRGLAPGCLGIGGALSSEYARREGGRLTQHMPHASEYEIWIKVPR